MSRQHPLHTAWQFAETLPPLAHPPAAATTDASSALLHALAHPAPAVVQATASLRAAVALRRASIPPSPEPCP